MHNGDDRGLTRRQVLAGVVSAAGVAASAGCDKQATSEVSGRTVRWAKKFQVAIRTPMSPATLVAVDGRLYATHERSLLAFAADTGAQLWSTDEGTVLAAGYRPPVVQGDRLMLLRVGTDGVCELHAVDTATGRLRWRYGQVGSMQYEGWPAASDGIACYSGIGNYAGLDISDGKALWAHEHTALGGPLPFGAPVMDAGTIYLPDEGGTLAALDARTGTRRWIAVGSDEDVSPFALTFGGGQLVSAKDDRVSSYDAKTGKKRWSVTVDGASFTRGRPQIGGDTVVLTGDPSSVGNEHTVVALGLADGATRWSFATEGTIGDEAAVGADAVYVPSKGALYALDLATGARRWTLRKPKATFSAPAVSNGLVYAFALPPDETYIEDTLYAVPA